MRERTQERCLMTAKTLENKHRQRKEKKRKRNGGYASRVLLRTKSERVGSAAMEKGNNGEQESLKKKKRYTYAFSDSMVLQKVLMATEVEQREFIFWFNFL